jgi:hypothetical protein
MSKQTAVEWLVEKLILDELIDVKNGHEFLHLQSKAKEMEKEQIIDAFKEGNLYHGWALKHEPEQYYNETYKKEEK